MNGRIRRRATRVALATTTVIGLGSVLALAAAPASGAATSRPTCSPTTVAAAQQQLEASLQARVVELAKLSGNVGAASNLTASDRATLTATLSSTTTGINALVAKAPDDTTCLAVWTDARSMVQTYRVFAVVAPQTDLDIAADTADAVEATLVAQEPNIQAAITAAGKAGISTTAAQATFADLQTQVTDAQGLTGGIPATVLAQTPASYPGSTPVFVSARDGLQTAAGQLRQANADLVAIVADLR
jgi:hypothetical protein